MDYQAGKLYLITRRAGYVKSVPFQRESKEFYPLQSMGYIPVGSLVLFVGHFQDKYDGNYFKVIYQESIGVVAKAFARLEEP